MRPSATAAADTTMSWRSSSISSRVVVSVLREAAERDGAREFRRAREQARDAEGNRDEGSPSLDDAQGALDRLAQTHHFGAAEFVGSPRRGRIVERARRRERDVADEDRLQFRRPAAEQRQCGRKGRQRGETIEELVLRPEHDRWAQHDRAGEGFARRRLAARPCWRYRDFGSRVGADPGDERQGADPLRRRRAGDLAGAEDMDGLVALPSRSGA